MSSSQNKEYEFEYYEKYVGDKDDVIKKIEYCPNCNTRMTLSHFSDAGNLLMEETSRCYSCDFGPRKIIHILN